MFIFKICVAKINFFYFSFRTFRLINVASSNNNNYIPGTCNIGGSEIVRRKNLSYILFFISICISGFYFFRAHQDNLVLAIVFFVWSASFVALLQVLNKFCVRYGLTGRFNFGNNKSGGRTRNTEFISADRKKTIVMIIQGVFIAEIGRAHV